MVGRRIAAGMFGLLSVLFLGQIGALLAISAPGGDPVAGISCVTGMALIPFLIAVVLWTRERLELFLSGYLLAWAVMMTVYFGLLILPHYVPAIAAMLRPENQSWIISMEVRWLPPIVAIAMAMLLSFGAWRLDRQQQASRTSPSLSQAGGSPSSQDLHQAD